MLLPFYSIQSTLPPHSVPHTPPPRAWVTTTLPLLLLLLVCAIQVDCPLGGWAMLVCMFRKRHRVADCWGLLNGGERWGRACSECRACTTTSYKHLSLFGGDIKTRQITFASAQNGLFMLQIFLMMAHWTGMKGTREIRLDLDAQVRNSFHHQLGIPFIWMNVGLRDKTISDTLKEFQQLKYILLPPYLFLINYN